MSKQGFCLIHETTTIDGECTLCELEAIEEAAKALEQSIEEVEGE